MYRVADDFVRLQYIGEMNIESYTDEDIEYMKLLLSYDAELISEGAAFTLYTSCKYIALNVAIEYQKTCMETYGKEIDSDIRITFFGLTRKLLPQILNEYTGQSPIENYILVKLRILYSAIIEKKMDIKL